MSPDLGLHPPHCAQTQLGTQLALKTQLSDGRLHPIPSNAAAQGLQVVLESLLDGWKETSDVTLGENPGHRINPLGVITPVLNNKREIINNLA